MQAFLVTCIFHYPKLSTLFLQVSYQIKGAKVALHIERPYWNPFELKLIVYNKYTVNVQSYSYFEVSNWFDLVRFQMARFNPTRAIKKN